MFSSTCIRYSLFLEYFLCKYVQVHSVRVLQLQKHIFLQILLRFCKRLPWQGVDDTNITAAKKHEQFYSIKSSIQIDDLCAGAPSLLSSLLDHIKDLDFEDEPQYEGMKRLCRKKLEDEGWQYDGKFDWMNKWRKKLLELMKIVLI